MARQGELFGPSALAGARESGAQGLPLLAHQLLEWQARLAAHQHPLLGEQGDAQQQGSLFGEIGRAHV